MNDDAIPRAAEWSRALQDALGALGPASSRAFAEISRGAGRSSREIEGLSKGVRDAAAGFQGAFRSAFSSAFDDLFRKGAKASDVLRGLALDISKIVLKRGVDQAFAAIANTLGGALGGAFGFSSGGVLDAGRVRAFARGGVVGSPTVFPMARGAGLMGEAGPEAILPLRRGADGGLGVAAQPGSGPVSVTIVTPDAASFARSRSQVASALARAVDRGRRNL